MYIAKSVHDGRIEKYVKRGKEYKILQKMETKREKYGYKAHFFKISLYLIEENKKENVRAY